MTDALREKLIAGGRALEQADQGDYVAGHITVRLPDGSGQFLMKPAGIGLDEMTPDNIVTVDADGQKLAGSLPRHNEVFIHSEVLRARPDLNCVIHTHPIHAVVFSALDKPLQAVGNDGVYFNGGLPVFSETTDLIIDRARGEAVARCLGEHKALILRNHGIVVGASSIEEAVWIAVKLERACKMQVLAESAGGAKLLGKPAEVAAKSKRANRGDLHVNVFNLLVRRWTCCH